MSSPEGDGVEELHGIGAAAKASGLPVSALRFYDGAGLLRPASVDPRTGYRFYTPAQVDTARLVAVLRAAGMPLAGIRTILRRVDDPAAVARVCAAHLRALEHDLADARRLLSTVTSLIEPEEPSVNQPAHPSAPVSLSVPAAELAAALRSVRGAVSVDPELPALAAVLVEVGDGELSVVATDRYRLHCASLPAPESDPTSAAVPVGLVDALLSLLDGDGATELLVEGGRIALTTAAGRVEGALSEEPFPDWRALVRSEGVVATVAAADVRARASAPATERFPGAFGDEREFTLLDAGSTGVWVDRLFLVEALDAAGDGATVELTGPASPLAVRGEHALALLMPSLPPTA